MVIYLDTNALIWLHTKKRSAFSPKILNLIESSDLVTGEINILELEFLHEIGRASEEGIKVYNNLNSLTGLSLVSVTSEVIFKAFDVKWTRDVFDRITVAGAMVHKAKLVTKDAHILDNCDIAIW